MSTIVVSCEDASRTDEAAAVATQLGLPFQGAAAIQLCLTSHKWTLKQPNGATLSVELTDILRGKGRGEKHSGLIRSCQPQKGRLILDISAGWGRDAAVLLAWGATVQLVERDPIMQVLLADGVRRAAVYPVSLVCAEAATYLASLSSYPDVIYYDPMHPARTKSAKVKQALQCLQTWLKPEEDPAPLLWQARQCARERVVLKWPLKQPAIGTPNHTIVGKTVRYDVYLPLT